MSCVTSSCTKCEYFAYVYVPVCPRCGSDTVAEFDEEVGEPTPPDEEKEECS